MTTDPSHATHDTDTNDATPTDELAQLRAQVGSLTEQLSASRATVARLERQQRIDELLAESDPIDRHAARLLTEAAVAQMDEPDVKLAIDDLRRTKPYLFRDSNNGTPSLSGPGANGAPEAASAGSSGGGGLMAGRARDGGVSRLAAAAEHAAASGDRRDLLRYLRLRRGA